MAANTPIPAGAYERLMRQLRADAQRKQFLEQMQAARNAEDMQGRHSVGPDTRRSAHPDLISNALLAGTLGGAMSAAGLPSVGLRAGLIGGGATDAVLNAGNPEGGAEISGGLAAAGALGRHSIPAALAALGIGSSEAQAMPFHSLMKRLNIANKVEPTNLYVNPSRAELLSMLKDARETYPTSPTVRLLRDQATNDTYGVEGSSILHDDMRRHLGLQYNTTPGAQGSTLPDLESELRFLQGLPKLAGGGVIKRLGKRAMSAMSPEGTFTTAPQGALSVVKNKGGNWLSGSVEDALRGLKKDEPNADAIWAALPRELIDKYWHASGPHQLVQANNPKEWAAAKQSLESPLNTWIDKQLTRYVKNDMATPEDPIRALAERGVLHFEPRGIRDRAPIMDQVVARRLMSGNPATERAVTPLGEQWERYADSAIMPQEVQELGAGAVGKNPWLAKLRPSDTVYKTDTWRIGDNAEENLGFDHLVDELSNALNPASGLPQHLQFPAERLGKVSVPQAVERVAQINAWRAAQQAEADALRANNAATVLHKEYPEKGMRWVELKQGTSKLPEDFDTWSPAEQANYKALPDKEARADLQDALKYEGDTMGHCVGGYCDDVLSGRTRIYSLRDAKGQPHVTVEVAPQRGYGDDDAMRDQLFTPELQEEWLRGVESGEIPGTITQAEWARQKFGVAEPLSRIIQIKGKQNRAPNPEYLPFVQDFVRSGQWSDVGDLQNTGLRRTIDAFNSNELKKIQEAGIEVPQWATPDDIDRISKAVWPGMAAGGAVKQNPLRDNFQGIIAAIEQELRNAA